MSLWEWVTPGGAAASGTLLTSTLFPLATALLLSSSAERGGGVDKPIVASLTAALDVVTREVVTVGVWAVGMMVEGVMAEGVVRVDVDTTREAKVSATFVV